MSNRMLSALARAARILAACALPGLTLVACTSGVAPEACEGACLAVANHTTMDLDEVRFSECSDEVWGDDRLTGHISPGESRAWEVNPGCWDIQASGGLGEQTTCSNVAWDVSVSASETFTLTVAPENCTTFPLSSSRNVPTAR
jgi:hypothetical protein